MSYHQARRAGSFFPAELDSALLGLALDVQNEVTEEIFRRQQFGKDPNVNRNIMIKAFVSSARLCVDGRSNCLFSIRNLCFFCIIYCRNW